MEGLELLAREKGIDFVSGLFGNRVKAVATGGGPTADSTFEFVAKLFPGIELLESYGATEAGGIAIGRLPGSKLMSVMNQVEVKLLEIPDLGIMKPFGEAWVRQKVEGMDVGYWNNPIDYAATFVKDDDGKIWFKTGDICEGLFDDDGKVRAVRVVERKQNFVKLATGEVLMPESIESLLEECPCVRHVCALAKAAKDGFVVIANPSDRDAMDKQARAEVEQVLRKYEKTLPQAVIVDREVWAQNPGLRQQGTLTVSLKPNRQVLADKFSAVL